MRILFIAMPFSIHTARWISQLGDMGWDLHIYSSMKGAALNAALESRGITYHQNFYDSLDVRVPGVTYRSPHFSFFQGIRNRHIKKGLRILATQSGIERSASEELARLIEKIKPDLVHTLETQHGAYLLRAAKEKVKGDFPVWIHSNWGIDLHFFGQLKEHVPLIRRTLSEIDVLLVEGKRDEDLARFFGYTGVVYTFPSVGGGFFITDQPLRPAKERKKILVKGTQDIVRRGLVALRALERCIDLLDDYEIILYSSNEITRAAAELFTGRTKKKITILTGADQGQMLRLNAEARINLCINMSDGLPNAMLEAMLMGAFPVQSDTSLAIEWIKHGETGMLVPPEDADIIEAALREALVDDLLVDRAAVINRQKIADNLSFEKIRLSAIEMYNQAGKNN